VLAAEVDVPNASRFRVVRPSPGSEDIEQLRRMLERAERPFAILGGGGWTTAASAGMQSFLEGNGIPAGAAFRRQDVLDNLSPVYAGDVGIALNPKLATRVREADVLLAVGPRLGEATTSGYRLLDVPTPHQSLVHVHPGAEELGRVYQAELPILAAPEPFAKAVADLRVDVRWQDWTASARRDYEAWSRGDPMPGPLDLVQCIAHMRDRVPAAIVTNGAGNHTLWIHRFWQFRSFPSQLAPTSGAMGYGVPAAIAAKLLEPSRPVVCFSGDGDFLMLGQELATAVQYDLPIIVLVVDNGMYGTIRMHQERAFPERVMATDLVNPDFAAYASAFGAYGETVRRTDEFPAAFERALASGVPAVLSLAVDPDAIAPHTTLAALRAGATR
jgi:acetolactate synthase I/II/III large subunit